MSTMRDLIHVTPVILELGLRGVVLEFDRLHWQELDCSRFNQSI